MERSITYFEKPGDANTDKTLELAKARAKELGIKTIVVATTTGNTAVKTVNVFEGYKVVAVTHVAGFRDPNSQELSGKNRETIEKKGGLIVTAAHAFGAIHRSLGTVGAPAPPSSAIGRGDIPWDRS